MPLGVGWIEEDHAFNFAVCAEHAESVKLLLYSPADLATPLLTFQFDPIRNKSGRIWHCRIPLDQMCEARYYGYSVSGPPVAGLRGFDHEKILLDPYAKGVFFPPGFDRKLAMKSGPNHEKAPLGVLPRQQAGFD
ncbi:MAG: glycogen-debranching protein, partial [Terriglobales bacterium]